MIQRYSIHGEGFTYVRPDNQGIYVKWADVAHLLEDKPKSDEIIGSGIKKSCVGCSEYGNEGDCSGNCPTL